MDRPIRILVVEDDELVRGYLLQMLQIWYPALTVDYTTTLAATLDALARHRYAAIILDLRLPDSPAAGTTVEAVHRSAPSVPIIVYSAAAGGMSPDSLSVLMAAIIEKGPRSSAEVRRALERLPSIQASLDQLRAASDAAEAPIHTHDQRRGT